jgi:hypothetical protein
MPPGLYGALSPPKIKKTCLPTTTPPRHYSKIQHATTWHTTIQRATLWHTTTWHTTAWRTTTWRTTIQRTTTVLIMAGREFWAQLSSGLWLPCSQRAISVA